MVPLMSICPEPTLPIEKPGSFTRLTMTRASASASFSFCPANDL